MSAKEDQEKELRQLIDELKNPKCSKAIRAKASKWIEENVLKSTHKEKEQSVPLSSKERYRAIFEKQNNDEC